MAEKVPRRMKRFNRQEKNNENSYEQYNSNNKNQINPMDNSLKYADTKLPTMAYEDVNIDEKNLQELKKIEQLNLEQKLALLEVEKFKKQNKRLPNKKEAEQMADSLYTQFKNNPEMLSVEGNMNENYESKENLNGREKRRQMREKRKEQTSPQQNTYQSDIQENAPILSSNIKELFSDEKKQGKDEFDLGLDLDDTENDFDNDNEIKSISDFDEKTCPHCGKPTEKIIYCSKCGTAFCKNCAKDKKSVCPKCGTKN